MTTSCQSDVLKQLRYPLVLMLVRVPWYVAYRMKLRGLEAKLAEPGATIGKAVRSVDLMLHAKRDRAAARAFLERTIDASAREPEARRALLNRRRSQG